jgi:hypothetical protein
MNPTDTAPETPLEAWSREVRLVIRGLDAQAERMSSREGEDQGEEIITGYKFKTGLWHRLLGLLSSCPAPEGTMAEGFHCACIFEHRKEFDERPPKVLDACGYHATLERALSDCREKLKRLQAAHELGWAHKKCPVCDADMMTESRLASHAEREGADKCVYPEECKADSMYLPKG